jgi:hypothetical protein
MAGVTVDLGRVAVRGPFTAALALVALAVAVVCKPNALWLVAAGAAIGVAHYHL